MLFLGVTYGQDSLQVRIDSTRVTARSFDKSLSDTYNGDDFDYSSVEGEAQNFLVRAINWFFRSLGEMFGFEISPGLLQIIEFIVYIALGAVVLYLIIRFLIGNTPAGFFGRKAVNLMPINIQEEHIENIDLDAYIKDALSQGNFRLAIRYMYLKTLSQLSKVGVIDWDFDKTNTDYYREITNEGVKQQFKQVSYLYDYIWYGEFQLDQTGFEIASEDFDRLTKMIPHA